MVKITGPLQSRAAGGSIADSVTFSQTKGRAYARKKVNTPNPNTADQRGMRCMFNWLSKQWSSLSDSQKATWIALALTDNLPAYNSFLAYNQHRWRSFNLPTKEYPAQEVGNYSFRGLSSATWVQNRIRLHTYTFGVRDGWSFTYFASTDPAMIASVHTAILVTLDDAVSPRYEFWTPPTVETWYCRSISATDTGRIGLPSPIRTAAPP